MLVAGLWSGWSAVRQGWVDSVTTLILEVVVEVADSVHVGVVMITVQPTVIKS